MVQYKLYEGYDILVRSLQYRYRGWDGGKQLEGTVDRLFRLIEEFCWTPDRIEKELSKIFKVFEHDFHQMVVGSPWLVYTLCPHHLVAVKFKVYTGYVPNKESGKVLGLSKLVRAAVIMGKRPILQEQYTQDLARLVMNELKADGIAVYVVGSHGCMTSRGVKQEGVVTTSYVDGCFLTEEATRNEFYMIVRDGR